MKNTTSQSLEVSKGNNSTKNTVAAKIISVVKDFAETEKTENTASSYKMEAMSFNDSQLMLPANQDG